jgi:arylamine N-acetyltransferase
MDKSRTNSGSPRAYPEEADGSRNGGGLPGPGRRPRVGCRWRGGSARAAPGASTDSAVREDQVDPAGRFRLADTCTGDAAAAGDIDVLKDGQPQYRLETRERSLADCVPTCWWQQTSPLSHFTRSTICSRLTPDGRVSIRGRMLIQTIRGGTRTEQRLDTDDALLAAYRDHFEIELSRLPDDPTAEPHGRPQPRPAAPPARR